MTYEEKQMAKLERYQELASRSKRESEMVYNAGKRISDAIPFGQPILVSHHSEKRHRRDIERINNSVRKSIELQEKAEYYENKVENILNPRAISSDDPEAITKLQAEIDILEKDRDEMKRINKEFKKTKDLSKVDMPEEMRKDALGHQRVWENLYNQAPFPPYCIRNIGASIRTKKKRIEYLKQLRSNKDSEEIINNITLKVNTEENRVQLLFPGKPEESVRSELKRNGFRWSPYNSAWQRQISPWAINIAKEIAGGKK